MLNHRNHFLRFSDFRRLTNNTHFGKINSQKSYNHRYTRSQQNYRIK